MKNQKSQTASKNLDLIIVKTAMAIGILLIVIALFRIHFIQTR